MPTELTDLRNAVHETFMTPGSNAGYMPSQLGSLALPHLEKTLQGLQGQLSWHMVVGSEETRQGVGVFFWVAIKRGHQNLYEFFRNCRNIAEACPSQDKRFNSYPTLMER